MHPLARNLSPITYFQRTVALRPSSCSGLTRLRDGDGTKTHIPSFRTDIREVDAVFKPEAQYLALRPALTRGLIFGLEVILRPSTSEI